MRCCSVTGCNCFNGSFVDTEVIKMKKHLKWKIEHGGGSMSCLTLPTVSADEDAYIDPSLCLSPAVPCFPDAYGLMSALPYGFMACSPVILERLGPHILRSHISTAHYKPIPHNDRIDLEAFRRKEPQEWNMDDVIGWMISVAKKHQIPVEDMNMHRFANCTGPLLMLMNQQNFVDRDTAYGCLLYMEFRKLIGDDSSILDEWMRIYKDEGTLSMTPSSSTSGRAHHGLAAQPCTSSQADMCLQAHLHVQRDSVIKAAASCIQSPGTSGIDCSSSSSSLASVKCSNGVGSLKCKSEFRGGGGSFLNSASCDDILSNTSQCLHSNSSASVTSSSSLLPKFPYGKIKKQKTSLLGSTNLLSEMTTTTLTASGKPRKRSQHTKGNKLWEFIRDALKDSETCPSVVRWEDQNEGVFRIVESERLARLWGEKKNNQKMTYEKLSRAMRTYYEKQILVPVPKTGLYPKKLVYKFGPSAHGWQLSAKAASIALLTTSVSSASIANAKHAMMCSPNFSSQLSTILDKTSSNTYRSPFGNSNNNNNRCCGNDDVSTAASVAYSPSSTNHRTIDGDDKRFVNEKNRCCDDAIGRESAECDEYEYASDLDQDVDVEAHSDVGDDDNEDNNEDMPQLAPAGRRLVYKFGPNAIGWKLSTSYPTNSGNNFSSNNSCSSNENSLSACCSKGGAAFASSDSSVSVVAVPQQQQLPSLSFSTTSTPSATVMISLPHHRATATASQSSVVGMVSTNEPSRDCRRRQSQLTNAVASNLDCYSCDL